MRYKPRLRLLICLMALTVLLFKDGHGQDIAALYTPKAEIPKRSYKSWSLFLVNNPEWVLPESNEKLKKLYNQFEAFGKSIGPDHLAVWFWSQNIRNDQYYKAVDVIRSAAFCAKLKLPPSKGPYLLVTTEYPGAGLLDTPGSVLPAKLENSEVLELNNLDAAEITRLLSALADKLVAGDVSKLNVNSEDYWRGWQRAYEDIRGTILGLSKKVTLKIKTSFFEIEL